MTLFARSNFSIVSLSSVSSFAFAWLYALASSINLAFSDSISSICFLTTTSSSPNFLDSDSKAFRVRSFEVLSATRDFILFAALMALRRTISLSMKSYLSLRFLSSSRLSMFFLTSPIFAMAIASLWSAV